ncbi:Carotenoid oxygenase [Corchorus capsularis]|uniref:Carotenoid oxygenase n=1 Tax=Corchorus capsularis TaxID=210143 RepID=A0A1R3FVT9_COCAP|nr:Carotenoid oxygenase [Corchorus capsularis]
MLHSLRISDGKATYCSRYVKTYKYLLEQDSCFAIVPNIASGFFGFGDIVRKSHDRGGQPRGIESNKVPKIGILPKYAMNDSELKWFRIPGFNTIHVINAWESEEDDDENILSVDNIFNLKIYASLEKVKINIKTGEVSREKISPRNLEFGTINPSYVGRQTRYAYLGLLEESPKMSAVVKIALETGREVARRFYGPNCYGGEPLFVRRDGESNINNDEDEDDGYVMNFVHDEKANESKFIILDAKSPELEITVVVKIQRRVPYGIHGLFLSK